MTENTMSGIGGLDWSGLIGLLVIAGIFGGFNGFGNNANNDITNEFLYNQMANDIRANATSIANTDRDVLTTSTSTEKEILENRYATQLGFQNLQTLQSACCCELKQQASENTQKIIDTITNNRIADLTQELNLAQIVASNQTQTQNILNSLGRYVPYSNSYYYGTTIQ